MLVRQTKRKHLQLTFLNSCQLYIQPTSKVCRYYISTFENEKSRSFIIVTNLSYFSHMRSKKIYPPLS